MIIAPFDQIVTDAELQTLRAALQPHGPHPLVGVALHPGAGQNPGKRSHNTTCALHLALHAHRGWVLSLRPRLIEPNSWSEAESALGELRAMGELLKAGLQVRPAQVDETGAHGNSRPEFLIEHDGQEIFVEVWTRTGDKADPVRIAKELAENARTKDVPGGTVTTSHAALAPFGMPQPGKVGDSILTNVISRLASVKRAEHQARSGKPFVVWIDLQGEAMIFDHSSQLRPLTSRNGGLYSGGYWCAFYARKGDVLFEGDQFSPAPFEKMLHEGRFHQTRPDNSITKVAAFILSSPDSIAVFEHPAAATPISSSFRRTLLDLPRLNIDCSLLNWQPGLVASTVEAQRNSICSVAAALS